MDTTKNVPVTYFYSYVQSDYADNCTKNNFSLPKIVQKLPKLKLDLPQISICENLGLSFC